MTPPDRKARDLELLDAVDSYPREPFEGRAGRVEREGREPTLPGPSRSRWCDGEFDVLCTSLDRKGALAEIHAFLSLQPVFPSKPNWLCYELNVKLQGVMVLADMAALNMLAVDSATYRERRYDRTQAIADVAFFVGFDGLIAPSARWPCQNLVIFGSQRQAGEVALVDPAGERIDWRNWRESDR